MDSGVTNSQWRGMKHFCIRDENDTESVRYAETVRRSKFKLCRLKKRAYFERKFENAKRREGFG